MLSFYEINNKIKKFVKNKGIKNGQVASILCSLNRVEEAKIYLDILGGDLVIDKLTLDILKIQLQNGKEIEGYFFDDMMPWDCIRKSLHNILGLNKDFDKTFKSIYVDNNTTASKVAGMFDKIELIVTESDNSLTELTFNVNKFEHKLKINKEAVLKNDATHFLTEDFKLGSLLSEELPGVEVLILNENNIYIINCKRLENL